MPDNSSAIEAKNGIDELALADICSAAFIKLPIRLFSVGWENRRRVFGCTIHIDLIDGKIWIQHDGTEVGVANEWVELGVPKGEIVLAYQPVSGRRLTEFAVG